MATANIAGKIKFSGIFPANSANKKVTLNETSLKRMYSCLNHCFSLLQQLGFTLEHISKIKPKHILALTQFWVDQKKLSRRTLTNYLKYLQHYALWQNRPAVFSCISNLLKIIYSHPTLSSKITDPKVFFNARELYECIEQAKQIDNALAMMLILQLVFNLSCEEVIACRVHIQDFGTHFHTLPGQGRCKRPRVIEITPLKRIVLDEIKATVSKTQALGEKCSIKGVHTLSYTQRIYNKQMIKLGFTHNNSTRHARMRLSQNELFLKEFLGFLGYDKKASLSIQVKSKENPLNAYSVCETQLDEYAKKLIEQALSQIYNCSVISQKYYESACYLRTILQNIHIDATCAQIGVLWQIYSQTQNSQWIKPERGILRALFFASKYFLIQRYKHSINSNNTAESANGIPKAID